MVFHWIYLILGEGLAGALPWKNLISFSKECGFTTPRLVRASAIEVYNPEVLAKVGEWFIGVIIYQVAFLTGGNWQK